MYDPCKCDLCQEQAKVPGAVLQGDLATLELCLDCRRLEIAVDGAVSPNASEQGAFESSMILLSNRANRVRHSFA